MAHGEDDKRGRWFENFYIQWFAILTLVVTILFGVGLTNWNSVILASVVSLVLAISLRCITILLAPNDAHLARYKHVAGYVLIALIVLMVVLMSFEPTRTFVSVAFEYTQVVPTSTLSPTLPPSVTPIARSTITQTPTPTTIVISTVSPSPTDTVALSNATAGWLGTAGIITFVSDRQGPRNIYLMDALGQSLDRLIGGIENKSWPRWSPHGSRLAYVFERTLTDALVIGEPDGSAPIIISDDLEVASIQYPDWSPRGDTLLLSGSTEIGVVNLYVIDLDGNLLYEVKRPSRVGNMFGGKWSPDGLSIIFFFGNEAGTEADIYRYDVRTTQLTSLTNFVSLEIDPSWSPDGQLIAFQRNGDIWTMNADGLNLKQLTYDPSVETAPAWSPDGKLIAFQGKKDGNWDVFVVPADGSAEPVNITNNPASDEQPTWKP